jgi:polyisoprenoid-binding protein YceI
MLTKPPHSKRLFIVDTTPLLIAVFMIISLFNSAWASDSGEQLVVFIQKESEDAAEAFVNETFRKEALSEIQKLALDLKLPLNVLDIGKGAPAEIKITPLIVYQNYRGRSIYQGRTTTLDRIRNFIRTSRYVPQGKEPLIRKQTPIWQMGRARVWAPLKIASLTGTRPDDYDDNAFKKEAIESIYQGFTNFAYTEEVSLERADRGFYMDFYPWLGKDNTLFLSLAVFSQFDCKDPVFHTRDKPLTGPWKNRKDIFRQAAGMMEAIVLEEIRNANDGDGFDPVGESLPVITWESMELDLPPPPEMKVQRPVDAIIPKHWVLKEPDPNGMPIVQFRFPAPLDSYAGEATRGIGEFTLPENLVPRDAEGFIEIDNFSVTMGNESIKKLIQSSLVLDTKNYKVSKFVIQKGESDDQPIAYGSLTPVLYTGDFSMKGKTIPLTATVEIEPILDDSGMPLLLMRGKFKIDLNDFDIDGPDGPVDVNHILLFRGSFTLTPKKREGDNEKK